MIASLILLGTLAAAEVHTAREGASDTQGIDVPAEISDQCEHRVRSAAAPGMSSVYAICYLYGLGGGTDIDAAFDLMVQADFDGDTKHWRFKYMLYRGDFGPKYQNNCAAFEVLLDLNREGNSYSYWELAHFFREGICVRTDVARAATFLVLVLGSQSESRHWKQAQALLEQLGSMK